MLILNVPRQILSKKSVGFPSIIHPVTNRINLEGIHYIIAHNIMPEALYVNISYICTDSLDFVYGSTEHTWSIFFVSKHGRTFNFIETL